MNLRFSSILGECDTKEWMSQKLTTEEFSYWLVLQIQNMTTLGDWPGDDDKVWWAGLSVVTLDLLPEAERHAAEAEVLWQAGVDAQTWAACSESDKAAALFENGGRHVMVWQTGTSNPLTSMLLARKQAEMVESLLGWYLDKPINRMDTTGWDFLKGKFP